MVKGVSKNVLVVKSPELKLFDQAIFFLREDALGGETGVSAEQVLQEARRVADGYVKRNSPWLRWRGLFLPMLWFLLGTLTATMVCFLILYP
ncbi:hypothetical protein SDC9_132424 [bioreactor metagenome]|uniref:Translation initiation factor 2 n=1 Tax=bioreactor metagenome TaxID=1076179 RepID=A0A645D7K4_9ZZZZ